MESQSTISFKLTVWTTLLKCINQLLLMSSGTISPRNSISPSFPFSLSLFPSSAAAFLLIRWAFCQLSLSQCFLFSPYNLHWWGIAMIICVCVGGGEQTPWRPRSSTFPELVEKETVADHPTTSRRQANVIPRRDTTLENYASHPDPSQCRRRW